ncbi:hypothetical protein [Rufibacter quisquiliarum]|uniref:Uncharacterized protein n=1 Tax=Rufibacter quisquiliarum TaxID=1549639 RepID=A0A839GT92_9BACT|nr:hypothetical protein [Rufibacter quisquiliarum]MBA9078026.1 hypothetical protein [Rufibacter quisquiliarum]
MKRTVTILLLVVMLTQAFSRLFILLEYQANKDFITKFLCLNREKPQLQCNGKCYLMKKLRKAEQTENTSNQKRQKQKQEITLFYQSLASYPPAFAHKGSAVPLAFLEGKPSGSLQAIFHPPQTAV